jgi:hypothetical protein
MELAINAERLDRCVLIHRHAARLTVNRASGGEVGQRHIGALAEDIKEGSDRVKGQLRVELWILLRGRRKKAPRTEYDMSYFIECCIECFPVRDLTLVKVPLIKHGNHPLCGSGPAQDDRRAAGLDESFHYVGTDKPAAND